jgi:hypothetical protein
LRKRHPHARIARDVGRGAAIQCSAQDCETKQRRGLLRVDSRLEVSGAPDRAIARDELTDH